jgi:hypothetical protein
VNAKGARTQLHPRICVIGRESQIACDRNGYLIKAGEKGIKIGPVNQGESEHELDFGHCSSSPSG